MVRFPVPTHAAASVLVPIGPVEVPFRLKALLRGGMKGTLVFVAVAVPDVA